MFQEWGRINFAVGSPSEIQISFSLSFCLSLSLSLPLSLSHTDTHAHTHLSVIHTSSSPHALKTCAFMRTDIQKHLPACHSIWRLQQMFRWLCPCSHINRFYPLISNIFIFNFHDKCKAFPFTLMQIVPSPSFFLFFAINSLWTSKEMKCQNV